MVKKLFSKKLTLVNMGILLLISSSVLLMNSCKFYSFTGGSVGSAKTYQVNFFENIAPIIEPGLDRSFTLALQDLIQGQTNLNLTKDNADLRYAGEITRYNISPMAATANQTAAQNRLSMEVSVRFENMTKKENNFERKFSHFYDFPANQLLESVKSDALDEIFARITQDIFTASLANW